MSQKKISGSEKTSGRENNTSPGVKRQTLSLSKLASEQSYVKNKMRKMLNPKLRSLHLTW